MTFAAPTTTSFNVEPIDDDWSPIEIDWGVTPACCDQPAIGPVSPVGSIPAEGWPADGFYDVASVRVGDPPGILQMTVRRWVSCSELPDRCLPDPPPDGIVGYPTSEVHKVVFMDEELTVVIRPIQMSHQGQFPDPAVGISGSGRALYELLSGFCGGSLPSPLPVNCGVDHAYADLIWGPYQAGTSLGEIEREIESHADDPDFPLVRFDDGASEIPCSADRACPIAYRGPRGIYFVMNPELVVSAVRWPGLEMYGWWTSLEIRGGRLILFIDAGQVAG